MNLFDGVRTFDITVEDGEDNKLYGDVKAYVLSVLSRQLGVKRIRALDMEIRHVEKEEADNTRTGALSLKNAVRLTGKCWVRINYE